MFVLALYVALLFRLDLRINTINLRKVNGLVCFRYAYYPTRDLLAMEQGEPRKMLGRRAVQIGIKGRLSELHVRSVLSIQDVTPLAHLVGIAHNVLVNNDGNIVKNKNKKHKGNNIINSLEFLDQLPKETAYLSHCSQSVLEHLGMKPGVTANVVAGLGRGGKGY